MVKKQEQGSKIRLAYIVWTIVLLTLVFGYVGRGFIREAITPAIAQWLYAADIDKAVNEERDKLQQVYPFGQIKYINEWGPQCEQYYAHWFQSSISCDKHLFRGQVSIKDLTMEDFKAKASSLEQSLIRDNWTKKADYSEMTSPKSEDGWWYSVHLEKKVRKNTCHLRIERDNDPTKLNAYLSCVRYIELP